MWDAYETDVQAHYFYLSAFCHRNDETFAVPLTIAMGNHFFIFFIFLFEQQIAATKIVIVTELDPNI